MLNALYNFQYCFPCSCMLNEHFFVNAESFVIIVVVVDSLFILQPFRFYVLFFFSPFLNALYVYLIVDILKKTKFSVFRWCTPHRAHFLLVTIFDSLFLSVFTFYFQFVHLFLFSHFVFILLCAAFGCFAVLFLMTFFVLYILLLFIFLRRVKFRINVNLVFV